MITPSKAKRFLLLFKGKSNTYVKNLLTTEQPEKGIKRKTKITQEKGEVNDDLIMSHLAGDFGVGICPITADGKCYFGVIDIDYYRNKIKRVLDIIRDYQLPLLPFRSKSGGLHLYLMLSKSITAKAMRETLSQIADIFSLCRLYGDDKVEIFPKQDKISQDGFGSAVTLPYFNAEGDTYTYLLDLDGNPVDFDSALEYITKHLTSIENVKNSLDALPYNDAPPCIQRILLSGCVGSEDTGRNNFLFSFALYASKKYGEDTFADYVREVNDKFECPIDESSITALIHSIKEKEYSYKCSDIPCKSFCVKSLCHKRDYGLGREKGFFSEVEYGQLSRYKTAEPYYVWELRLQGSEGKFKKIVFKDEGELLDQKNFAKNCVRFLNFAPKQVNPNVWYSTLNKYLTNVKDITVSAESDTSALSIIQQMFIRYLSNKQARRDSPYQIRANLCVRQSYTAEDGKLTAKFYFTHTGFSEYLRNNKVQFDQTMLRETLMGFGAEEDVLRYPTATGDMVEFKCWSKTDDAVIDEAYKGEVEIEENDRAYSRSVSEATNREEDEDKGTDTKPYTEADRQNAMDIF